MLKLIKNEFIKIFKRKNTYILLFIGIALILTYNIFTKITNTTQDINRQYENAYKNDKLILENYNNLNINESYEDIIERITLEKYAIENNIQYNIMFNSENKNIPISKDARILLMKTFNNFDIIIIFLLIYFSTTILSEEYTTGTIKTLLTKPYTRLKILLSKIISLISIIVLVSCSTVLFQQILGGILFGFDSYSLEAIRYNPITNDIETMNLGLYMIIIILSKMPMYILLTLASLLFGVITNNIALNILISLGLYLISTFEILINNISKFLFIFNWDISKYLFFDLKMPLFISFASALFITTILIYIFNNKDIKNE